jgi:hypothetical protein
MSGTMSIDVVFVVMLGAAVWTVVQLNVAAQGPRRVLSLWRLGGMMAAEGLLCAGVWALVTLIATRALTLDLVLQSALIGAVWAGFSFAARLPFRTPASLTK